MMSEELNLSLHSAAGNTITSSSSDDSSSSTTTNRATDSSIPLRRCKSFDPLAGRASSIVTSRNKKATLVTKEKNKKTKHLKQKQIHNHQDDAVTSSNNNSKEEQQRLVTYRKYPTSAKRRNSEGDNHHHNSTPKDCRKRKELKNKSALGYHCQRRKHRQQKKKIQLEEVEDQYLFYDNEKDEDDDTCSLLSSMTLAPVAKNKSNSVSFSTVSIAEYSIKPYSNVQCCIGPAIGLDEVINKKKPINIDLYEYVRSNERKTNINELKLSAFQREQALMNLCGLSRKELNHIMQKERKNDYMSSSSSSFKGKDSGSLECLMPFLLPKTKQVSIQSTSSTSPNKKWKNVFVTPQA